MTNDYETAIAVMAEMKDAVLTQTTKKNRPAILDFLRYVFFKGLGEMDISEEDTTKLMMDFDEMTIQVLKAK